MFQSGSNVGNATQVKPKECFFTSDGLTLHYTEWGEPAGKTLVLIHGNWDHARSWDSFVASLLSRDIPFSHIVCLDLRGHGESQWAPPGSSYQHENYLFDLMGLLRHLQKDIVSIVAHSLGGSVAMLFAGCFPARVQKLVLVEAVGPYARSVEEVPDVLAERLEGKGSNAQNYRYPSLEAAAEAIKKRFPLIPASACLQMASHGTTALDGRVVWKYDPRLRYRSHSILSEEQIRAFIQRIDRPTLLIFGSESGFLQSPRGSRVALFKNSRVVEIQGAGHHIPHERPEELAECVVPYLALEEG